MSYPKIYHPIVGIIKRGTDKAILLVVTDPEALTDEDTTVENWIPKSQIQSTKPMQDVAGNSEVYMSEWIIGQKDLKRFIRPKSPVPPPDKVVVPNDDIPF